MSEGNDNNNKKDLQRKFGDLYNASSLGGELGLKGVRLSPSQYLGSRSVEGALQAWLEIVQNSVDESAELLAFMKMNNVPIEDIPEFVIDIRISGDDTVRIVDTGRGVPADFSEKFGRPVVEAAFEEINVGGKGKGYVEDGESAYVGNTIGKHGSGAACANATSDYFHVDTYVMKDNKHYRVEWEKAEKVKPTTEVGSAQNVHGTIIEFRPSRDVFELYSEKRGEVDRFYFEQDLLDILTEYAYNTDNIKYNLKFQQEDGSWKETVIRSSEHEQRERIIPYVRDKVYDAQLEDMDLGYQMKMFIGLSSTRHHFLTCNMLRLKHGTHQSAVGEVLGELIEDVVVRVNKEFESKKIQRTMTKRQLDNMQIGSPITYVSMYLSLFMDDPDYSGQSKDELRTPKIKEPMKAKFRELLDTSLSEFKEELISEMTRIALIHIEREELYEKEKEKKKAQAERRKKERELLQKGDPNHIKGMSEEDKNLTRARNQNLKEVILYMVEGETAKDAMLAARDVNSEAIYSVVERPPNVFIHNDEKLWNMKKFKELYKVLFGDNKGNYKAIVIATDPDADGGLIKSYLIAFIYKFFPHYLLQGRVFMFNAPKYSAKKGDERIFLHDLDARKEHYQETGGGWEYFSYKGLGSIPTNVLELVLNDPTSLTQIDKKSIPEGMQELHRFLTDKKYKKKYVLKNYASPELFVHEQTRKEVLMHQEVEYDVNELDTQYTYEPDLDNVRKITLLENIVTDTTETIEVGDNFYDEDEEGMLENAVTDGYDDDGTTLVDLEDLLVEDEEEGTEE